MLSLLGGWDGEGRAAEQPAKACSRSCVMKSEDLRSRYTSFGERHSMLLVALIQVASLGADQLSLGTTLPPSSSIVLLILV